MATILYWFVDTEWTTPGRASLPGIAPPSSDELVPSNTLYPSDTLYPDVPVGFGVGFFGAMPFGTTS